MLVCGGIRDIGVGIVAVSIVDVTGRVEVEVEVVTEVEVEVVTEVMPGIRGDMTALVEFEEKDDDEDEDDDAPAGKKIEVESRVSRISFTRSKIPLQAGISSGRQKGGNSSNMLSHRLSETYAIRKRK